MKFITLRNIDGGLVMIAKDAEKLKEVYEAASEAMNAAMQKRDLRGVYRHADNLSRIAAAILDIEDQEAFNAAMRA